MKKTACFLAGGVVILGVMQGCDRRANPATDSAVAQRAQAAATQTSAAAVVAVAFKKSDQQRTSIPGGACNFDIVAGQSRDNKEINIDGSPLSYDGWAALDTQAGVVGKSAVIQLVGSSTFELPAPKTSRPDVGSYFKNPALAAGGFGGKLSAAEVPSGSYVLKVLIETSDGKWVLCPYAKTVAVRTGG